MAASSSSEPMETLQYTPTWVVAAVCTVIVIISLLVERFLHYIGKFLKHNQQDALFEALQKLKEELMLLGFISLLLTVFENTIRHICIPTSFSLHMLPCKKEGFATEHELHHGKVLSHGLTGHSRRLLSESSDSEFCRTQGKVPLLSLEALHQLHIFIFVLALVHVVFCATTMVLGGAKIRKWKHWEDKIRERNSKGEKSSRHACSHRKFVSERASGVGRKTMVISWTMSFFKQFYASVTKSDYKALRSGFIMRHCSSNINFDFHKYMMRTLEDDFKIVVGISWYLWLFVVIFLLLNVNVGYQYGTSPYGAILENTEIERGEDKEEPPKREEKQRNEAVAVEGKEKGKKRGRGGKRRRRRRKRGVEGVGGGYKRYVFRVLKQVHPGMAVSSRAMAVLDGMMTDMFERLADEAARLSTYAGKVTLSSREIQDAVRLVLPGELGKHAISEGTKAVSNYMSADHGT